MRRALFPLALLALATVASAQSMSVKVCDQVGTRCASPTLEPAAAADAGVTTATVWTLPVDPMAVWLIPAVNKQFINCAATGSSLTIIPNGRYLMRVLENDVTLTIGVGYDGGAAHNHPFPLGFGMKIAFYAADGGTPVGCQSADGGGDVYFTGTY